MHVLDLRVGYYQVIMATLVFILLASSLVPTNTSRA